MESLLFEPRPPPEPLRSVAVAFLGRVKDETVKTYHSSIYQCAKFLAGAGEIQGADRETCVSEVARAVFCRGKVKAFEAVSLFKADLVRKGLSNHTINGRVYALAALHKLCSGMVPGCDYDLPWSQWCEAKEEYSDTSGCGWGAALKVLERIDGNGILERRDRAVVCLFVEKGVRRNEVHLLNVDDFDPENRKLRVLRKRRRKQVWLDLGDASVKVVGEWLQVRGKEPGPLFVNLDPVFAKSLPIGDERRRLTGRSLHRLVKRRGVAAGVKGLRPHKLRHTSITQVLEEFDGDLRIAQDHSGHEDINVLRKYDDNRGRYAKMAADRLGNRILAGASATR
jgi:integrase/recombinase XerC